MIDWFSENKMRGALMNIDETGSSIKRATIYAVELIEFRKGSNLILFPLEMQRRTMIAHKNVPLLPAELGKCLLFCFWLGGKAHET